MLNGEKSTHWRCSQEYMWNLRRDWTFVAYFNVLRICCEKKRKKRKPVNNPFIVNLDTCAKCSRVRFVFFFSFQRYVLYMAFERPNHQIADAKIVHWIFQLRKELETFSFLVFRTVVHYSYAARSRSPSSAASRCPMHIHILWWCCLL